MRVVYCVILLATVSYFSEECMTDYFNFKNEFKPLSSAVYTCGDNHCDDLIAHKHLSICDVMVFIMNTEQCCKSGDFSSGDADLIAAGPQPRSELPKGYKAIRLVLSLVDAELIILLFPPVCTVSEIQPRKPLAYSARTPGKFNTPFLFGAILCFIFDAFCAAPQHHRISDSAYPTN